MLPRFWPLEKQNYIFKLNPADSPDRRNCISGTPHPMKSWKLKATTAAVIMVFLSFSWSMLNVYQDEPKDIPFEVCDNDHFAVVSVFLWPLVSLALFCECNFHGDKWDDIYLKLMVLNLGVFYS